MWVESAARFASHSAARIAALALNHLLDQHAWARDRLAPYAGRWINYRSPPLPDYRLVILDSGRVAPLSPEREPAPAFPPKIPPEAEPDPGEEAGGNRVTVTLKPGLVSFLARRRLNLPIADSGSAFEIAGAEDLGATMRDLMFHLDWDAEEDLSRIVGDVAAHRIAAAGRDLLAWQKEAGQRLARNFAEYWSEEKRLVPGRGEFEAFRIECAELSERLERLEARFEALIASSASRQRRT